MGGFRRHVEIMVADGPQHGARNLELPARLGAHARGARDVARIVVRQTDMVVLRLVEAQLVLLDEIEGEFADVLRNRIGGVEEVERTGQRIEEAVGDPPGVAAFAEHQPLDLEVLGRLADAQRHLLHVVVRADEDAEIRSFGGVGAERPLDSGLMKDLGVADQPFHVGRGEEVRARRHQQYVGAGPIERQLDAHAGLFFDIVLEPLEGRLQRLRRQAEVVADLEHLADDLVGVLLTEADRVHDVARGHGNFGRIDAVGTEHGAAAALRALMEISVPVGQHLFGEVLGADQPGQVFSGPGEVTAVDLAQQVLASDRHVLRVAGAEKVMALVGAGAAFDAGIEIDPQRPRALDEFAEPGDRLVMPAVDELAGKAERLLHRGGRGIGLRVRHRARAERGHLERIAVRKVFGLHVGIGGHAMLLKLAWPRLRDAQAAHAAFRACCRPDCARG